MDIGSMLRTDSASRASPTTSAGKSELDYNAFLQLLITQMRNQDPTDPMDSTQYMAQFAAFANVEQAIQTNSKLDALLTSSALAQADSVLGRTATSADGSVTGVIESLRLTASGLVAHLDTGAELLLGEGVSIS